MRWPGEQTPSCGRPRPMRETLAEFPWAFEPQPLPPGEVAVHLSVTTGHKPWRPHGHTLSTAGLPLADADLDLDLSNEASHSQAQARRRSTLHHASTPPPASPTVHAGLIRWPASRHRPGPPRYKFLAPPRPPPDLPARSALASLPSVSLAAAHAAHGRGDEGTARARRLARAGFGGGAGTAGEEK